MRQPNLMRCAVTNSENVMIYAFSLSQTPVSMPFLAIRTCRSELREGPIAQEAYIVTSVSQASPPQIKY